MPLQEFPSGEGKVQPTVVPAESAGAQSYGTVGWKDLWRLLHKLPINAGLLAA